MAQQGLERIPYAVGPDFRMEPVRARFPEQGGSAVSLVPGSFVPDAAPEPKPVASEDPGYTGDIWRGLKYGAQVQLPKMAGQALQFFGADGVGKSMVDAAEARATPDMQESAVGRAEKSPYSVRGSVYEAATNAVPSLGPGAAGAAAGAAVGSVVPGVGTALGALAGYALGSVAALPMFYGSQAKESYDAVKANQLQQGKSESEADAIARRTAHAEGTIEAGGELVADVIPFAKLFKPFAKPVGNAIVKSALVPTIKGAAKTVGGVVAAEVGTEMAQLAGQNAVRKSMGGTGPGATWEETQKVIMPTALMSVIPGMAGAGAKHVQQSAALRALVSPDTDPETRSKIAIGAAEAIKAGSPEVSKAFAAYAAEQIAARAPIEIADDAFYASAAGPQPIEGTFIPADRGGPPVATQDPGGDTFTQDREPPQFARPALPAPAPLEGDILGPQALPAGQAMLPPGAIDSTATEIKDAAPAPTLRQQATSRGLLNHSARPSPDMLKRLMRIDDGMAQRLYDEWASAQTGPKEAEPASSASSANLRQESGIPEVSPLEVQAHAAATSPFNQRPQPTDAQKKAGNYAKGHVRFHGMDISIENPAGSVRAGKDEDGKAWETTMQHHYGYIKGTVGRDKDHLDVFIKPGAQSARTAYVIDQTNPKTGAFDEHKIVLGADSEQDARTIYQSNYQPGWNGLGAITAMPMEQFKDWIKSGKTKKPIAYVEPKGIAHPKPSAKPEAPAVIDPAAPYGKVGIAPFSSQVVGLKDNGDGTATVMRGEEPFYDFENGDPITVPTDATAERIRQAVTDAGALSSRDKWFGVAKIGTKPAETGTGLDKSVTEPTKPPEQDPAADVDFLASIRAEFRHEGFRIYPISIKGEARWAVQSLDNAEKEQKGERQIGGDAIVDTAEQAKKQAEDQVTERAEKAERQREFAKQDAANEAKKEANRGLSITERRANAALDKPTNLPVNAGVGRGSRREAMESAVSQGRAIVAADVPDTAAYKRDEDEQGRLHRAGYGAFFGNDSHPQKMRFNELTAKLKNRDNYQKKEYRLYNGRDTDGGFYEITKTEYDYAKSLMTDSSNAKPVAAIAGKPVADMPVEQLQKIASGESKTFGSAAVEKASAELARRDEADSPKATKEPWQYGELEYGDKYIDEVVLPQLRKELENAHGGRFQEYPSKAAAVRGLKERIDTLENHRDAKARKYYASLDNHYGAVRAALADGKPVPPVAYESYDDLKGDVSAGRIKGDGQEVARVEQPQHIEAGQVEPATAPVIAASLKESAKNTPMNIEQAREWLLSEIDKAIIDAKSAKEEGIWNRADDKVNLEGVMDVGATIGFKTFNVPGDGKFRVLNLKESLQKFKKQVAASPGFKKNATRPMSLASGNGGKTSVRDLLDDGEYVLAADYGHLTGKPLLFGAAIGNNAHPVAYTDAEPVDIGGVDAQVGREWNQTGKAFSWSVIETTTGAMISSESTKEKAISKVLAKLDEHGVKKLIDIIKETPKVSQAELERQFTDWGSEEEARAQKQRDALERVDTEDRALWNSIWPLKDGEKRSPNPWNDIDHLQVAILAKDADKAGKGDEFVSLIERRRGGTNNVLALAARKALEESGKPGKQSGGVDYKGFERTPTGNGSFTLKDGNLLVKVEAMGQGKFQASHGSAKSSPHINSEQGAVDWAANLRDASRKTTAYPFYSNNKLYNAEGTAELPKNWTGVARSDSGKRFFYLGQENGERSFNPLKAENYEDALKEADGLKNDKPVVPEGYREVARGYFGGTVERPIYAPFAEGDRVRFIGGHAGNIQSFIGGPVTTGAIIKYDNGLTGRAEWRDVEAAPAASIAGKPVSEMTEDQLRNIARGLSPTYGDAAVDKAKAELRRRTAIPLAPQASAERFEIGRALTKEQRKSVIKTLVDVYKANDAPREFKGQDRNGNERYGYAHSPEFFVKSDITGAMVRYYVTLPDGRIAHPTELFPEYSQSDIDGELERQKIEERNKKSDDEFRLKTINSRKSSDLNEANRLFWKQNPTLAAQSLEYVPALLTNGTEFIRTDPAYVGRDLELLGDGWQEKAVGEAGGGKPKIQEHKIGDALTIMGRSVILAKQKTIAGVRYELFNDAKLKDTGGATRVIDVDSGNVVSLRTYDDYSKAEAAYEEATPGGGKDAVQPAPAWHTTLPVEGLPPFKDQSRNYAAVPLKIAGEAYDAIRRDQLVAGMKMYAYVMPAANGLNGIVRLLPEDQTPPKPWKLLDGEGLRVSGMTRDQVVARIGEWLRREPILADEKATPKMGAEEQKQATDFSPLAKDVGGRIAWTDGTIALIEGYSVLNGEPVYIGAKGGQRTRVDIQSFTGNTFTAEEKAALLKARAEAVAQAAEELRKNPNGPFSAGPVVISDDIPEKVAGVAREWIRLLGLDDARIVITTPAAGAEMAKGLFGRFRRIGKANLSGQDTNGIMQPLGDNDYHIALRPGLSVLHTLEALAHELGHIVEKRAFAATKQAFRDEIRAEHQKWLKANGGGRAVDLALAMRAYRSGTRMANTEVGADQVSPYWKSFGEWFADQVSRWATTTAKPMTAVERYFKRLADRLATFFRGERAKFLPNAKVAEWLDSLNPQMGEEEGAAPGGDIESRIAEAEASGIVLSDVDKSEGDAGAPRESRAAQDSIGTAGRLAITQAKSIVAKFLDEFKRAADLDIRIVASPDEIPTRYRPSRYAEGVYHSDIGTIWLVTDNLMRGGRLNALRVFQVLLHEAVGHYGMAAMMGDKFKSLKARVLATAKAKGPVVDDYYKPGDADYATVEAVRLRYPGATDDQVANEVLARMAETDPGRTLFGYVRAVVRQWLRDVARKLGIQLDTTVAELNDLVALASGYMRRGTGMSGERAPGGVAAASLADAGLESRARPGANEAIWDAPDPTTADNVIYTLQDKHIDLKRVQAAIKDAIGQELPDQIDPYLQEELFHGRAAKATEEFLDRELQPLIGEMKQRGIGMDSLETYLWARHAGERNAQIAKINPDMPDGGSGLTDKQARDVLAGKDVTVGGQTVKGIEPAKLRGHAELARKIDMMVAGNRLLLELYELETPSTLAAWKGAYQHYVPLHREDVDSPWAGQGTGQGYSVRGASTKRATGSYRPVENILANLVMQRKRIITRGEKNRVAQAIYGLAKSMPNPDFWKVDDVPKTRVPKEMAIYHVMDGDTEVANYTRMSEADKHAAKIPGGYVYQSWGERVVEQDDPLFRSRPNVVWARFGGEDRFVIFNERDERAMRLAGALKNLDADDISHFLGEVSQWTRYFASINTQYNPVFGVVNLTRDTGTGLLNLQSTPLKGKQAEMLGHVWQALPAIYRAIRIDREGGTPTGTWAELWEEFQEVGGQTGYRDMFRNATEQRDALEAALDPKWWQRKTWGKVISAGGLLAPAEQALLEKAGKPVLDWLSDYNTTMENAIRLSAYKVARDQGMSRERAASLAKNLTVNFNRKGQAARQLGALYAFFNASVQGTARMLETLTHGRQPGKALGRAGKQIVYGGLLLGSMQAMWLAAAGFDDDEPPEFVRDRAIIIPLPDKRYLSVPLPLGFHVLPALGRIGTEQVLNGFKAPGRAAFHVLDVMADAFNPIGNAGMSMQTLAPTVLDPAAALAENKDWTGKQIYRENFSQLDPKPGHQRTKDTATALSKWLSQALNSLTGGTEFQPGGLSPTPDQIDYLIGQVTGGVGREISKLAQTGGTMATGEELPAYKIPLIGRFYGDAKGQAAVSSRFYENLKAMNMHQAEFMGLAKSDRGEQAKAYLEGHPEASMFREADRMQRYVGKLQDEKRKAIADRMPSAKVKEIDAKITEAMQGFNARVAARRAPAVPAQ